MKIRTSLILACFLLSVLPLGGIVLYSYSASRSALEATYQAEARRLTEQMDRRLAGIRDELQSRLAEVSQLPSLEDAGKEMTPGSVVNMMGDVAPMIDSIEIVPPPIDVPANAAAVPSPPSPPIVIPIPKIPGVHAGMSEQQRAGLNRITQLGEAMGTAASAEERSSLQQHLKEAQKAFGDSVKASSEAMANDIRRRVTMTRKAAAEHEKESMLLFGRRFHVPMTHRGSVVAHIKANEVIRRVLGTANEDQSEITFAIDREGHVYTRNPQDRQVLDRFGIPQRVAAGKPLNEIANWIVVQRRDPVSGLRVAVARPFGEDLDGLRRTAARNCGYGIILIFVAMIGIVPIANHITGDVELVTRGAERIAHGDLSTRLPVHSKNEIGQLATAFNRMAEDLTHQQKRIVEQERAAAEYERKSADLEEARRFQLSMLPKDVPRLDAYDIAVSTQTATEVGGDYYDFDVEDGGLAITIGDATGHGARAGTMVAVIKALFAGYSGARTPAQFLREATEKVRRMDLGRMAMALLLARFEGRQVTVASAGMPPLYVRRPGGAVEEVTAGATPLGRSARTIATSASSSRPVTLCCS